MVARSLLALAAAVLLTGWTAGAAAQETDEALAKKYYLLGEELYNRSDYEGARKQFEQSYKYSKKPGLLFNIARCYEGQGQLQQAIESYRRFLATNPKNAAEIQARITNLEKRLPPPAPKQPAPKQPAPRQPAPKQPAPGQPQPKDEPRPPGSKPAPEPRPEPQPDPDEPTPPKKGPLGTVGWITIGAGGAALVTGVILGAMAAGKAGELEDAAASGADFADVKEDWDAGEGLQVGQIVGLVAGGALVATGAVLLYLHYRSGGGERRAWLAPAPLPGGACVTGTWRF